MINTKQKFILIIAISFFIIGGVVWGYDYVTKTEIDDIPEPVAEEEKQSEKEIEKEELQEGVLPEVIWSKYINDELGFSIDIPDKVYGCYRCDPKKAIQVPVKVFEDNENSLVYISQEYYYEAEHDSELHRYVGECKKITYSLEGLKNKKSILKWLPKAFLGWTILIGNVIDKNQLDNFIKENIGQGCFAESQNNWEQDGVYEITIKGEDWWEEGINIGNTTCPIHFAYKVLYLSEKNKVMAINLGQESTFATNPHTSRYQSYDEEMIDSFRFE